MKKSSLLVRLRQNYLQATILILASVFIFGCGTQTTENELDGVKTEHEVHEKKIDANSNVNPDIETTSATSNCANPYYPIDTSFEREYKIEGTSPAKYVLKQKMNDGDGFTETRDFASDLKVVSNWSCTDEGLRHLDYNNSITTSGITGKMETLESSGISIPKVWENGKKWANEYKIRVELLGKSVNGTVKVDNQIVSMDDNVSVQAGDYVAARIDSVINIKMSMQNTRVPATKLTISNWYAPKVGLIKQETKMGSTNNSVELMGEK